LIKIRYSDYSEQADLAGRSVAEAREQYESAFEIPERAKAYLNGKEVSKDLEPELRLCDEDELVFKAGSKIPVLAAALLAALAVTGGMFAYTYFTATTTLGLTAAQADFADVSANSTVAGWTVPGFFMGTAGTGDLFDIDTTPASYGGDFVATVYLSNAQQLAKVYRVLVLKLEVYDSGVNKMDINGDGVVDAAGHEDYALLTLRNGATDLFVTQTNPNGDLYKVQLAGGFYRSHIWGTGWGSGYQAPQLLIEVAQR
jgi:hypothetical protein